MDAALELAEQTSPDVVIANDPDADRCAVAVPGPGGWRMLRGDEVGRAAGLARAVARRGRWGAAGLGRLRLRELDRVVAPARGDVPRGAGCGTRRRSPGSSGSGGCRGSATATRRRSATASTRTGCATRTASRRRCSSPSWSATLKTEGRSLVDRLDDLAREHGVLRHRRVLGAGGGPVADRPDHGPAARRRRSRGGGRRRRRGPTTSRGATAGCRRPRGCATTSPTTRGSSCGRRAPSPSSRSTSRSSSRSRVTTCAVPASAAATRLAGIRADLEARHRPLTPGAGRRAGRTGRGRTRSTGCRSARSVGRRADRSATHRDTAYPREACRLLDVAQPSRRRPGEPRWPARLGPGTRPPRAGPPPSTATTSPPPAAAGRAAGTPTSPHVAERRRRRRPRRRSRWPGAATPRGRALGGPAAAAARWPTPRGSAQHTADPQPACTPAWTLHDQRWAYRWRAGLRRHRRPPSTPTRAAGRHRVSHRASRRPGPPGGRPPRRPRARQPGPSLGGTCGRRDDGPACARDEASSDTASQSALPDSWEWTGARAPRRRCQPAGHGSSGAATGAVPTAWARPYARR